MPYELAIVMPVYNESECIDKVLYSWCHELNCLSIDYLLIVINDGSKDNTKNILEKYKKKQRVEIINKKNTGHGPTILEGYKIAAKSALWIFQCDSDDELKPSNFKELWEKRINYDAVFGVRKKRNQNLARKLISYISRITVKVVFGRGVIDPNIPYRLIRACFLLKIVENIPINYFAPNIIISGMLIKMGARILNCPVPYYMRVTGTVSLTNWKLWKSAIKSFLQTVFLGIRLIILS